MPSVSDQQQASITQRSFMAFPCILRFIAVEMFSAFSLKTSPHWCPSRPRTVWSTFLGDMSGPPFCHTNCRSTAFRPCASSCELWGLTSGWRTSRRRDTCAAFHPCEPSNAESGCLSGRTPCDTRSIWKPFAPRGTRPRAWSGRSPWWRTSHKAGRTCCPAPVPAAKGKRGRDLDRSAMSSHQNFQSISSRHRCSEWRLRSWHLVTAGGRSDGSSLIHTEKLLHPLKNPCPCLRWCRRPAAPL